MSEFKPSLKRPLALVAVALSSVALGGCWGTDGGDKTINVGVACAAAEHPRIIEAATDWDGHLSVTCEDAAGDDHSPIAVKIPNVEDGNPAKANFNLAVKVNNYGENIFTQQASASHDGTLDTPPSMTIMFKATDTIKAVDITKVS